VLKCCPHQELANLPIDLLNVPHGANVYGMRKWIQEELLEGPLAEHRNGCKVERRRPEVPVLAHDVRVACADGSGDEFGMRVYEPQIPAETPRPAILMFHGGGWIHGDPRGDDCKCLWCCIHGETHTDRDQSLQTSLLPSCRQWCSVLTIDSLLSTLSQLRLRTVARHWIG
jgi:hypothetical protein